MASDKKINTARVCCAIAYFIVSLLPFIVYRKELFYFTVPDESWNYLRFLWCLSAISLGFSLIAFAFRRIAKSPFPEYITHYPLQLIAMATLVFSVLHIFEATSGYLFYYLSFSLCFTMGFMVDRYWGFVQSLINRLGK